VLISSWGDIQNYLVSLVNSLINELREHAYAIDSGQILEVAKADLPSAATHKGRLIMVTNDVGGYTPAFSDGTNWRRTADRNIIS
jgi:hypothetical protein